MADPTGRQDTSRKFPRQELPTLRGSSKCMQTCRIYTALKSLWTEISGGMVSDSESTAWPCLRDFIFSLRCLQNYHSNLRLIRLPWEAPNCQESKCRHPPLTLSGVSFTNKFMRISELISADRLLRISQRHTPFTWSNKSWSLTRN